METNRLLRNYTKLESCCQSFKKNQTKKTPVCSDRRGGRAGGRRARPRHAEEAGASLQAAVLSVSRAGSEPTPRSERSLTTFWFPSRRIFNELSSDTSTVPKIEEEGAEDLLPDPRSPSPPVPNSIYQTSSGQYSTCI